MPLGWNDAMRTLLLILALLLLASGLVACRQASCVWQNTKACVSSAMPPSCCPDEQGRVFTEPVYDVGCGTGQEQRGRGAFAYSPTP